MGILSNFDEIIRESDAASERITELESYYADLLQYGVRKLYDYGTFKKELEELMSYACQALKPHKDRKYAYLDCRSLTKVDAENFVKYILKEELNRPIVIIDNIESIPDGDSGVYDPEYVKHIILNSWTNKTITVLIVTSVELA